MATYHIGLMVVWCNTLADYGKVDSLSLVFVDKCELHTQQVGMTNNSDSNKSKNPYFKQLNLAALSQKSADNSGPSSQTAPEPNSILSKLTSALNELTFKHLRAFDQQLQAIWFGPPKTECRLIQQCINRSLRLLEDHTRKVVSEGVARTLTISKTHEAFVIVSRSLSDLYSDSEAVLLERSSNATELGSVEIFSAAQLSEVRRRMERELRIYGAKFDGVDLSTELPNQRKTGRKPKYDWPEVTSKVWGEIHLGTLKVNKQKDIEERLVQLLSKGNDIPEVTTVRPYARVIMKQYEYDPMDEK